MLYNLLTNYSDTSSFLNFFNFLTVRTGLATITAMIIVFLIGEKFINFFSTNKITNPITKDKVNSKNKIESSVIFKFRKIFETIVIVKKLNIANGTPELALADRYIKKGVGLNMIFFMFLNHSLSEVIAQYISSTWL